MVVLIFTAYPWLNISTPLIETVNFFLKKKWKVIHFGIIHPGVDRHGHKSLDILDENYKFISLGDTKTFLSNIKKIIFSFVFYWKYRSVVSKYNVSISFDPGGLYLSFAWLIFGNRKNRIYHSLEISNHKNKSFLLEKTIVSFTDIILSQDQLRARILKVILGYKNKVSFIPNSTSGPIIRNRTHFFHQVLNIPVNKKILLMTGTIETFMGSDSFLDLLRYLPENWVAVIHGWIPTSATREKVENAKLKFPEKLFLSYELVDNKDKFNIFSSVDLCYVNFKPEDLNLKYGLYSAGKLYDSAKVGVPVLINDLPGSKEFIKKYQNGFLLKKSEELPGILEKVKNENTLDASHQFYLKNEFGKNYENFLKTYCPL
ncbi:hypothetical protein EHR01_05620 [Leptospira mtsangambouensis]|uniref:Glycosyltransferase n=1 Tax=Leptospira mtsangambouensis TaxID=2484912 RepID=A0ABY2P560_9LEPT|nr:hypothetical protein [Leptospira mtsangambouensis]TGM82260.1 hypothetical protein EHR01_05620 [Leptospira mtsangambouensis]